MAKANSKQNYGLGRVAFKAHLAEIQREMDAGYTMALIYETRKASLGISYSPICPSCSALYSRCCAQACPRD